MVNLLVPAGLALLALVPVVIAMHLWRIRYRRLTLSSTLLWQRVLADTSLRRPRRLPSQYLLLLLQLVALTGGAAAMARPAWLNTASPHHLLVAVDTSLPMSATDVAPNRLAHAATLVQHVIDKLGPNDTMTLIDVGPEPRVLASSNQQTTLRSALSLLRPGYGPSSLVDDLPLLSGLRATSGSRTLVYLFASRDTLTPALTRELRQALPAALHLQPLGTHSADRRVDGIALSCTTVTCQAFARLNNTGSSPFATDIVASVDGATLRRHVTLPAHGSLPVALTLPATAQTVELHIDGRDALSLDDTAWAVVPLPVHRSVLLVSDAANDPVAEPLAQALHAIPNVTLTTVPSSDSAIDQRATHADLTILEGTAIDILPPGNLLLINPSDGGLLLSTNGTAASPSVTHIDPDSSLLRDVDLGPLLVSSATSISLPAWAHADIQGSAGPLLFSGVSDGRHIAVLPFDPRPSAGANASNLATLLAFPTLIGNVLQTLDPAPLTEAPAGQTSFTSVTQPPAWLHQPNGQTITLHVAGGIAAIPALPPGLYSLSTTQKSSNLAVNIPASFSQNPAPHLPYSYTAAPLHRYTADTPLPSIAASREVWALLIAFCLCALGGEWWYYARHT